MPKVAGQFRGENCMPTYEYLCKACSHRFEQWQKMTDEPLTICPECGGFIRRVFYPAGIVFKGSGFYKTDHNASSAAGAHGNAKNGTAAASSETSTAGESKVASTESSGAGAGSSSSTTSESKVATATK